MNGHWQKQGRLFDPESKPRHPKLITHAANPLPVYIDNDTYRIYYSGRDEQNRSSVGAVDIDIVKRKIIQDFNEPFFLHGPEDSFFSHGVSIGNTCLVGERLLMYFMGWKNTKNKHWYGEIGALEVHKNLSLSLVQPSPILGLSLTDSISLSYPWVSVLDDGTFHMWYGSTISWDAGNGEMLHIIKSAKSVNGIEWENLENIIPYIINYAQAFSRPTLLKRKNFNNELWFSFRSGKGPSYRIGRATSIDNQNWGLEIDKNGIEISNTGWDSEMNAYPFVFRHKEEIYMLYNGNGYGKTGFGIAKWIEK